MTVVFPFPAMGDAALASGLDGHWGLKSQEGADMWMEKIRKVIGGVQRRQSFHSL